MDDLTCIFALARNPLIGNYHPIHLVFALDSLLQRT
jgi:hypothetical protein